MIRKFRLKTITAMIGLMTLAACVGGSGGGSAAPTNSAPVARAGSDQTVGEFSSVTLDGSGSSDANAADTLTYTWAQTTGISVTIVNSNAVRATFDAPGVVAGSTETLTFSLTVSDGTASSTDTVDIFVQEALAQVIVAGTVSFQFVLPNNNCGLDFNNIETRPIRAATVQLLDATNTVLGEVVSGDDGAYSFADIAANTDVRIRVRAELQRSGSPSWNVEVRDNVDTSPSPPPLSQRPLYVVQWPIFSTGIGNISNADFTAETGWGETSYTGDRAAAPFAILDTIYNGMRLVLTADSNADFPALDAFWSINNTLSDSLNIDAGELPTSFYSSGIDSLFLLGDENIDTEEFDDHVIVHEWGHYFEDNFSRSDSIGGAHSIGGTIDPRLAFGEGWATALAAMALDNPQYCDSHAAGSTVGFGIDTEGENRGPQGFYNEMSVATLLYDLWDTHDDGSDNSSIGFAPIYAVMTGPQVVTEAFTSLFTFGTELRAMLGGTDLTFLDSQLARENIDLDNLDIYGSGQTTVPSGSMDVLPIHTVIVADGSIQNLCSNNNYDLNRDGNKLSEYRYLRMTITEHRRYRIVATTVSVGLGSDEPSQPPGGFDCVAAFENDPDDPQVHTYSDPDFGLFLNGTFVWGGFSCTPNREETLTNPLTPGDYVLDLIDFRFADVDTITDYPDRVCIDVSVTPN